MLYKVIVICLFTFCVQNMAAQQGVQMSQYMYNTYQVNPAYAGLDYSVSVTGAFRSQWNGLTGSPRTAYVNAHMPFYLLNGAVGFELFSDKIGAENNTSLAASYNYVSNIGYGLLSFGGKFGLLQKSIDGSILRTPEGDYLDGSVNHNDPLLSQSNESGVGITYAIGVFSVLSDFQGGISFNRLPAPNVNVGSANIKLSSFINGYFKYTYRYSNEVKIEPSLLVKSDFNIVQTDLSLHAKINGSVFGGIGVRGYNSTSLDAIVITGGVVFNKNYTLTYSFDTGLSDLKRVNEGSHEVTLNYNLQKILGAGLPPKIIYNPRNL